LRASLLVGLNKTPITFGGVRTYRRRAVGSWLLIAAVALAGCSSHKAAEPTKTAASPTTAAEAPTSTAPVQFGISPDGVTTSVSAPSSSTEEEYYQACHWARLWMAGQGGDPHAQIEPYLGMIQASKTGEKGSWNTPWTQLPAERQAGLIVAVAAAADGGCD
jgi:Putative lipoprotein LpqV